MLYDLSILGPLLSALAVTGAATGKAGVKALFGKALQWRFSPVWYLVALFTVTGLKLLSIGIYMAMGGQAPDPWLTASTGGILFVIVTQFGYVMLAEEVGWRAFALPRLLDRFGSLGGTLMLGVLHACWHLPMFLVPGSNQYGSSFPLYLFTVIAWAIIMTFLYDRSGGSALPGLLFHASLNVAAFVLGMPQGAQIYQHVLYGVAVLALVSLFPRPLFGRKPLA